MVSVINAEKSQEPPLPVTIICLLYNQEKFVAKAIGSLLLQDYPNLTVIVSDDFSTDESYFIARDYIKQYKGGKSVLLRRAEKNLGLIAHLWSVLSLVNTSLVVLAGGDDISHSNRVSDLIEDWKRMGKPSALGSAMKIVDVNGDYIRDYFVVENSSRLTLNFKIGFEQGLRGASMLFNWSDLKNFGQPNSGAAEDLVISYRAALVNGVAFSSKILVDYTAMSGTLSSYDNTSLLSFRDSIVRIKRMEISSAETILNDIFCYAPKDLPRIMNVKISIRRLKILLSLASLDFKTFFSEGRNDSFFAISALRQYILDFFWVLKNQIHKKIVR